MSNAPVEEPQGFLAAPGFVKSQAANNDYYIEQFKDNDWYPIIKRTHEQLSRIIPGYNISQIKDKFGGLRYYFDLPEVITPGKYSNNDTREKIIANARGVVNYAEAWVDGFEAAKRQFKI